ncbi:uncharacterized protein LOC123519905 isoform X6 [Portunus trituberculatus]|uniref:uncharacterized protein LOC123519905 isoform X6 n=1 Tax=Portunus trituberculatus TaxID=210409 RepID=UPI001E1CC6D5|nr:uncharacterized protein LOC123519905 isoform X6 [Portunus trituberculatus]
MEAVEGRKKRESKEEDEDERRKGGRRGGSKPQYLGASCIRITKVKVPAAVEIGGAAELDCEWEREGDTMYSIKWYQGSTEFYRYTPSAQKQIQIFEPTTLDVDRARSSGGSVRVANITVEAEGPFHCEVSAEGPTFHTASDSAKMWVVALPNQGPIVNGVKGHYQVRDWVDLTCISPRSRPAPRLTFTINGSPEGRALVTCLAEIPKLWQRETQVALSTRPSYQASVRGTTDGGGAGGGGGGDGAGSSSLLFLLLLLLLLLFSQRHLLTWA